MDKILTENCAEMEITDEDIGKLRHRIYRCEDCLQWHIEPGHTWEEIDLILEES